MRYCSVLFGVLATLTAATAIEERNLVASTVLENVELLSFHVSISGSGKANKKCDVDDNFAVKAIIKDALDELGPINLGLASDSRAEISVVDLALVSEMVSDSEELSDSEEIWTRRRLKGTWIYKGGATCYLCSSDNKDRRELTKKSVDMVSTGRDIPDSSIAFIEDTVTSYFETNPDHCMASTNLKVKLKFFKSPKRI